MSWPDMTAYSVDSSVRDCDHQLVHVLDQCHDLVGSQPPCLDLLSVEFIVVSPTGSVDECKSYLVSPLDIQVEGASHGFRRNGQMEISYLWIVPSDTKHYKSLSIGDMVISEAKLDHCMGDVSGSWRG